MLWRRRAGGVIQTVHGGVAEWLCSGLQSRLRRFDSDPRLHIDSFNFVIARVVKLVDTRDLKSLGH